LGAEKAQKSRARRLTSTAVAVEAAAQPQAMRLRESSGRRVTGLCDDDASVGLFDSRAPLQIF
jgi:hypothetical protein